MVSRHPSNGSNANDPIGVCTPCLDNDYGTHAVAYCPQCKKRFCQVCLAFHTNIHKDHKLLHLDQVLAWGSVQQMNVYYCNKHDHKNNKVEMLCRDDDQVCCYECVYNRHRHCKDVVRLSDAARGIRETPEFQKMPTEVARTLSALDKAPELSLQESRDLLKSKLEQQRYAIETLVDTIEGRTLYEFDKMVAKLGGKVKSDRELLNPAKDDLTAKMSRARWVTIHKGEVDCYLANRLCRDSVEKADALLERIERNKAKIVFREDETFIRDLSTLNVFGTFGISTNRDEDNRTTAGDVHHSGVGIYVNVKSTGTDMDTKKVSPDVDIDNEFSIGNIDGATTGKAAGAGSFRSKGACAGYGSIGLPGSRHSIATDRLGRYHDDDDYGGQDEVAGIRASGKKAGEKKQKGKWRERFGRLVSWKSSSDIPSD